MDCTLLLILSVLSTYFLSVQGVSRDLSKMADVVIAIDTRQLQQIQFGFPTFFDKLGQVLLKIIGPEGIHVSIVQFSNEVHVPLSLKKGITPDDIKSGLLDTTKMAGTMPNQDVAAAIRKSAFAPEMGKRHGIPSILSILTRRPSDGDIRKWETDVKQQMMEIGIDVGTKADIIVAVNKYDAEKPFYFAANNTMATYTAPTTKSSLSEMFEHAASEMTSRLVEMLETCPHQDELPMCYYERSDCLVYVSRVTSSNVPADRMGYCVTGYETTLPCNITDGCKQQCEKVGKWTECQPEGDGCDIGYKHWRPINQDPTTKFIFKACLQHLEDRVVCKPDCGVPTKSTIAANCVPSQSVSGFGDAMMLCLPLWVTLVIGLLLVLIAILIIVFLVRVTFKAKLEAQSEELTGKTGQFKDAKHHQTMEPVVGKNGGKAVNEKTAKANPSIVSKQSIRSKHEPGSKSAKKSLLKEPPEPGRKSDRKSYVKASPEAEMKKEGLTGKGDQPIFTPAPPVIVPTIDELRRSYRGSASQPATRKKVPTSMEVGDTSALKSEVKTAMSRVVPPLAPTHDRAKRSERVTKTPKRTRRPTA